MSKKAKAKTNTSPADRIRILMYNVGFGDAFLVLVPTGDIERRILIDCGSLASGGHPIARIVSDILAKVTDASGNARIDLVIATHRHRDHISGFADPRWKKVAVGEVWMPWTEDPRDPTATAIRDRQARLAAGLAASFANTRRIDVAIRGEMKRLQEPRGLKARILRAQIAQQEAAMLANMKRANRDLTRRIKRHGGQRRANSGQ